LPIKPCVSRHASTLHCKLHRLYVHGVVIINRLFASADVWRRIVAISVFAQKKRKLSASGDKRHARQVHRFASSSVPNDHLRAVPEGPPKRLACCAGPGTEDKDAASVRTDHPVPARCGLYYFEVKVVSSGNDGFIGEKQLPLGRGRLCGHQSSSEVSGYKQQRLRRASAQGSDLRRQTWSQIACRAGRSTHTGTTAMTGTLFAGPARVGNTARPTVQVCGCQPRTVDKDTGSRLAT